MVPVETLERLSRFLAGELSADEAARVEAELLASTELQAAAASLEAVRAAAHALPGTLTDAQAEALVQRALPRQDSAWVGLGGIAGLVALVLVAASAAPPVGRSLQAEGDGSLVIASPKGQVALASGARFERRADAAPELRLQQGWAALKGAESLVTADGTRVIVDGEAVLSVEPLPAPNRVTEGPHPESPMPSSFLKRFALPLSTAAVGSGLTLWVVQGHARVEPPQGAPVVLSAGERLPAAPPLAALPARAAGLQPWPTAAQALGALAVAASPALPADLARLTPAQLAAEVLTLRAEKAKLLAERSALEKKADGKADGRSALDHNYYRYTPEQLKAMADRGELRLRAPQLSDQPVKLSDELAKGQGLTDAERTAIGQLYQQSHDRIRAQLSGLYGELGGEPGALAAEALLRELESKSLEGDREAAVQEAARERAGQAPAPGTVPGSPLLRAFRGLVQEDDKLISSLDALLGPERAQALLNDDHAPHSQWSMRVGP